jgi:molybdate transport system substrate-binding protein
MKSQTFFRRQTNLDAPHPLPPPHKGEGKRLCAALLALVLSACGPADRQAAGEPMTVLAAASLTDALSDIGEDFTEETGIEVRFSFASSSTLARQIEAGAPAAIFASANDEWMDYLEERGLIEADTRVSLIGNALVLVAPESSPLTEVAIGPDLDLAALLGPDGRIAVGDPAHVPAGQYARQAFEALGLWDEAEPRLAAALDVRAALVLVERGETPLGVVYATDAAISEGVKVVGTFPEASHAPITYPFAILAGRRTPDAEEFLGYATGAEGLAVFARYGFVRR